MNITKNLYITTVKQWRYWLTANFDKGKGHLAGLSLERFRQAAIPYSDAVEVALSFGWIDSQVKHLDAHSSAQRFSPRKSGAEYSQANKERLKRLVK